LKDDENQVTGVQIEDQESGEKHEKGKAIINATGVFTNSIMKLNDTVYKNSQVREFTLYSTSLLLSDYALMIPKQVTEGFYLVPWHNKIVVGTTDTVMKSTA
jgi:glycerol-3-phosphate dehydrogenase